MQSTSIHLASEDEHLFFKQQNSHLIAEVLHFLLNLEPILILKIAVTAIIKKTTTFKARGSGEKEYPFDHTSTTFFSFFFKVLNLDSVPILVNCSNSHHKEHHKFYKQRKWSSNKCTEVNTNQTKIFNLWIHDIKTTTKSRLLLCIGKWDKKMNDIWFAKEVHVLQFYLLFLFGKHAGYCLLIPPFILFFFYSIHMMDALTFQNIGYYIVFKIKDRTKTINMNPQVYGKCEV